MDEAKAKQLAQQIEALCEQYGVWVQRTNVKKPKLSDILLEISIKITK